MSAQSDMLSHLMSRRPGYTLPRALYTDPEMFDVDMERIWYRDWLLVGAGSEIPKTGNHMTVEIGAYSVIVVRGADGVARAFHNSCRHRGSRICKTHKGSAPRQMKRMPAASRQCTVLSPCCEGSNSGPMSRAQSSLPSRS